MKKEYIFPEIIMQEFVVSTSYCDQSTVLDESLPPKNEDKDDMNGWTPWQ